jgi:hypothetical protein
MKILIMIALQFLLLNCNGQNNKKMEDNLLVGRVLENINAKKIVIFGGSPYRRHEIVELLSPIENLSIYATLSEEEGMTKIEELDNVDIVLIGGRYSEEQRFRIRKYVQENHPKAEITEPGYTYAYSNPLIFENVKVLSLKP